jgi:hypothetical protein
VTSLVDHEPLDAAFLRLGYTRGMWETNWTPRDIVPGKTQPEPVPRVAFWGQPRDQFHSAIAVVGRNGLPDQELATDVARRTWAHVVVSGDRDASLWLFDENGVRRGSDNIPTDRIAVALQERTSVLARGQVAAHKLRLRQYALYEAAPETDAFLEWAVEPTESRILKVVSRVIRAASHFGPGMANAQQVDVNELSRWAFRLLGLRIAMDRGWDIAQGLNPEGTHEFESRATEYPVVWRTDSVLQRQDLRLQVTESDCVAT